MSEYKRIKELEADSEAIWKKFWDDDLEIKSSIL